MKKREGLMEVGESELTAMTAELGELHHDTLPRMRAAVDEWIERHASDVRRVTVRQSGQRPAFDRRRFLALTGAAAAGGLILAACSSPTSKASSGTGTATSGGGGSGTTGTTPSVPVDVQVAGLAASLESLAVATYRAGIKAVTRGKLGRVPPAFAAFATTALSQHHDHAAAWNAILAAAGYKPVATPDPVLQRLVDDDFAKVRDLKGLAKLALTLENVAAATYLNGLTVLSSQQAIGTAASIQPVEMQHAAIVNLVLGQYPVPAAFASTAGARPLTDYPVASKGS